MSDVDEVSLRLGKLESNGDAMDKRLTVIEKKVDELLEIASSGRGAWFAILKIGGLIAAFMAGIGWMINAISSALHR